VVSEVLSQTPDNTRALRLLFQSYSAENRASAGLQKVREYASQHPASAPVQQFLGQILLANGDRQGARKALEAAKAANPGLVSADLGLAELDTSEGKREEARKRLSAIIASHPDILAAHLLLAQVEIADGKPALAIEYYRRALALDEKNVLAINNLASLLSDARQPDEALKYAQQAKELAPASPAIDDTIGWTYYQKGMFSQAVSYLESAVSKESTARRQYHLAMARLKAGDLNRGRQALEAARKLDPNLPEAQMANQLFSDTRK
jgi:tetratricopeptide (TPR) repeat protein